MVNIHINFGKFTMKTLNFGKVTMTTSSTNFGNNIIRLGVQVSVEFEKQVNQV